MKSVPWKWERIGALRSALRWPWNETLGGKYGAGNDNGWVQVETNGIGRHWVHMTDYRKGQR